MTALYEAATLPQLRNPIRRLLYYLIVEFAHDPRYAELLAEPLTDEEVRDLLERLGSKEFGGPEHSTVGAVVEATGANPATIGNLLALIRKEDFEEKFGLKLEEHEERIDNLEDHARNAERTAGQKQAYVSSKSQLDPYQQRALERLAKEERQREMMNPVAIVAAVVMVLFFIVSLGGQCDSKRKNEPYSSTSYQTSEGTVHLDSRGNSWVELKSGGIRAATEEELSPLRVIQSRN